MVGRLARIERGTQTLRYTTDRTHSLGWVPVSDRLPGKQECTEVLDRAYVLVYMPLVDPPISLAWYDLALGWIRDEHIVDVGLEITHWMPLPVSPGEAEA